MALRRWVGAVARLAEVRRRAALWGSIAGDGVVAVRDVVQLGDDLVVVTDLVVGGGLDSLVARRGGLTPGQVVTLVVPLAQTLAVAHGRGLVHGRISSSNIVLDRDGRPLLTDWLLAGEGQPAADVTALSALARKCLTGSAPEGVLSALRSAVEARTLSDELSAVVAAEPLLVPPTVMDVPLRAHSRVRATSKLFAVAAAAVLVAIGTGVRWGHHDGAAAGATLTPSPVTTPATPTPMPHVKVDWLEVVRPLEHQRVGAFRDLEVRSLEKAELPGTSLWRRDRRVMARLRAAHVHPRGLHVHVTSAWLQSRSTGSVLLRVVDSLSSYELVDSRGTVRARYPARVAHPIRVVLRRGEGRWLIAGVSRRSR